MTVMAADRRAEDAPGAAAPPAQLTTLLRLPDGRYLAWVDVGDRDGFPVLYFHGFWDCRLRFLPDRATVRACGVRFLSVDRPGIGRSDPRRGRRLLDWADDVRYLADELGLERFGVVGFSAGGPFALACAHRLPDRVTGVAVAGGYAPLDGRGALRRVRRDLGATLWVARRAPGLVRTAMRVPARSVRRDPEAFAARRRAGARRHGAVREWPTDQGRVEAYGTVEALRQGTAGPAWEFTLLARPWGFDPAAIRVPVWFWHGENDGDAPLAMVAELANAIPGAHLRVLPGEGHVVTVDRWPEVLAPLVAGEAAP